MPRPLPHASIIASLTLLAFSGCFRSLPPPDVRQTNLSPESSYDRLCAPQLKRASLVVNTSPPLSGVLECGPDGATVVLFTSLHVRVRTITVSRTGVVRDEVSYLSPFDEATERFISDISDALDALGTKPYQETPRVTVRVRASQD